MRIDILTEKQISQFRRDGYVVVDQALPEAMVEACKQALANLARGISPTSSTNIYYEAGQSVEGLSEAEKELRVRRFDSFCSDSEALLDAAMAPRLHAALDQLVGCGRSLFQEMALVKPPEVGGAKPVHQDCAYFLIRDPAHAIGTWTALDQATVENGCMNMIPGSHLWGPKPHIHESLASCFIRDEDTRMDLAVPVPMNSGDTIIFHGLLHHFTNSNRSKSRRRALQFHYASAGAQWGTIEDHQQLFHQKDGSYGGCVQGNPPRAMKILQGQQQRPVVVKEATYA